MKIRPMFCLVKDATVKCGEYVCPCGWPKQPCIQTHPDLRTDTPPEPGATFDGETWRA